jgi:hypothetical protein
MTRLSPLGLGMLVLLALFAAPAPAQTTGQDSAVGDVVTEAFRPTGFVFDARSGSSGESPTGSVTWFDRVELEGGPVTCLTVTGNRATIGFENQGDAAPVLRGGFVFVEDGGTPGVGKDRVRGRLTLDPPAACPPNTEIFNEANTVTSGDLTVNDAPARPTTKAQCKHGGWRTYGLFKNQGDCVSFVATKGKNPPANQPR